MSARFAKILCTGLLVAAATTGATTGAATNTAAQNTNTSNTTPPDQAEWAETCEPWDDWNKAAPPFQIHGNTYYVGTCGIAVILVTGENGHILIDSGTAKSANLVANNIRALGLDPADVSIMLHSHEHHDHVGGFAALKTITNARITASVAGARVLGTGLVGKDDPQYGTLDPMNPAAADTLVLGGEVVELGKLQLTAVETPGHSPGALSWQWRSCSGKDARKNCKSIIYADSLSPVSGDGYRFSDHAGYVAKYRQALGRVAALDCDILLTPHPSHSKMIRRIEGGDGLVDPSACRRFSAAQSNLLDKRLDAEAEGIHGK